MQRKWTIEESKQLIELYRCGKSNIGIGKILNRTKTSVANKLHCLGLKRPRGINQNDFGMKNSMQGKKHSDATKEKLREKAIERFKNKINHPSWKGGRRINHNGYVCVRSPEHPRAVNGYIFEHILVMEKMVGRQLEGFECVHHINMIPTDNSPENLMLFSSNADHRRYHAFMNKKRIVSNE